MATTTSTKSAATPRTRKTPALKSTAAPETPDLESRQIHTGEPSLFDRMLADQRNAAQERIANERREFQARQVEIARNSQAIADLKPGSIAQKIATAMLDAFVDAAEIVEGEQKVSKTQVAFLTAFGSLSDSEKTRDAAVRFGRTTASTALQSAYASLKAS